MDQVTLDKEYLIMSEIEENNTLTQRDLSQKLGVSVSTVNVLINKMAREGLIKVNQVSKRQMLYMITPNGILEKTKKTVQYLKVHYRVIYETKEKIKSVLKLLLEKHDAIFILITEDEMGEIIKISLGEFLLQNDDCVIRILDDANKVEFKEYSSPILLHVDDSELEMPRDHSGLASVNLMILF